MSRHPRFIFPGQPQHVIQRGNNRDVTFVSDDDYKESMGSDAERLFLLS